MWAFDDPSGNRWDVALGRESWGVLCALFVKQVGGEVRQLQLDANTERDAHAVLDGLAPPEWRELLGRSLPRQ